MDTSNKSINGNLSVMNICLAPNLLALLFSEQQQQTSAPKKSGTAYTKVCVYTEPPQSTALMDTTWCDVSHNTRLTLRMMALLTEVDAFSSGAWCYLFSLSEAEAAGKVMQWQGPNIRDIASWYMPSALLVINHSSHMTWHAATTVNIGGHPCNTDLMKLLTVMLTSQTRYSIHCRNMIQQAERVCAELRRDCHVCRTDLVDMEYMIQSILQLEMCNDFLINGC